MNSVEPANSAEPAPSPAPAGAHHWSRDRMAMATVVVTGVLLGAFLAFVTLPWDAWFGTGSHPGQQQNLVILLAADNTVDGQHRKLVDEWNQGDHVPKVTLVEIPSTSMHWHSQLLADLQSGVSVDVVGMDVPWTSEFASAGLILPWNDNEIEAADDYLAKPLATCKYGRRTYALPFESDAGLLYYNRTLLAKLGQKSPGDDQDPDVWSWARIATLAKQGADAGIPEVFQSQFASGERIVVSALESMDSVPDWAPGRPSRLTTAQLSTLRSVAQVLHNDPDPVVWSDGLDRDSSRARFAANQSLFMRNTPVAFRKMKLNQENQNLAFGVTQLPEPMLPVLGGQNLAVAKHSSNPARARELIRFLTSADSQRQMLQAGGVASTRKSPYNGTGTVDGNAPAAEIRKAIENSRSRPALPGYLEFSQVLQTYLREQILIKDSPRFSEESVDEVNRKLNEVLSGRNRS